MYDSGWLSELILFGSDFLDTHGEILDKKMFLGGFQQQGH